VTSGELARARGLQPLARFVAFTTAGVEPERFGIGPVPAIRKLLKLTGPIPATRRVLERAGMTLDQMDRVEINEAFASVVLSWAREFEPDMATVNPNGGAIALGHPLGASGARITAHLVHELGRRGGRHAVGSACIGGGQGIAVVLERIPS